MTDVPGKRVWGRWPQRVQGGALVFPLDYINKKGQVVTRSVLRTTAPDPLYLESATPSIANPSPSISITHPKLGNEINELVEAIGHNAITTPTSTAMRRA